MPVHLIPMDRRGFLHVAGAGIAGAAVGISGKGLESPAFAEESAERETEDDLVYLLNDTHIGEKHPADSPVPTHLRQAAREIIERPKRPAAVVINGDLALKDGQPGDYRHLAELLAPFSRSHVPLHLTLGNHDHRETFYEVLKEQRPESPPIESRHISVVETRFANLFLLDSLHETMVTPGTLGETQRQWLTEMLDARADKPALIVAHHNPRLGGDPKHFPGGLTDSQELWKMLAERRQVKAYIHGHIHDRSLAKHEGIHIINTPATSYVADPALSTTGWTTARLTRHGVTLTTHCTDSSHKWHGESTRLEWRA